MKAYLIARVSTADQVDALPAQIYRLNDYAERYFPDHELHEFHESAYKGSRDKFNAVLDKIVREPEVVAVVFDKIDRLTRDSSAIEMNTIMQLVRKGQIDLHFISDNLTLNAESSAAEFMQFGFGTIGAQYYSDSVSYNVRRRNAQLRRDGIWTGKAPFGYRNTLKSKRKWVEVHEIEADVVKRAYELYATNSYSLKRVKQIINDEYGIKLSLSFIGKMLNNPFYMGIMRVKDELYPHNYDVIIPNKLYQQVQAVIGGYASKPRRTYGKPYIYRGLIRCAACGCTVTFEIKKGKYIYGHCTQWKGKHGAIYVSQKEITDQLKLVFKQIQLPKHAYLEVLESLQSDADKDNETNTQKVATLTEEIKRYETRIQRNYDAFLDQLIDETLYKQKHQEMSLAKRKLEDSRKNIELMSDSTFDETLSLLNLCKQAPELFKNADIDEKRTLLNLVISNLELDDDKLRWKLKEPYDLVALCNENSNWQGYVESNHGLRFWRPLY